MHLPGKETTTNKIPLTEFVNVKYAYIVAIDRAGNISNTLKITLPTYKITINPNGGTWRGQKSNTELTGKQNGQQTTIENPEREGYNFKNWTVTTGTIQGTTYTNGVGNGVLTANWEAKTDTPYTIKHWKQNLETEQNTNPNNHIETEHNGKKYTLVETENLKGTTDNKITPQTKQYQGFIAPETVETTIKANGTTEINYYYKRRTDLTYTVEYINKKTGEKIGEKTETNQTYETEIKTQTEIKQIENYKYESITPETLKIGTGQNVVKIYYNQKQVKITVKYIDIDTNQEIIKTNVETDNVGEDLVSAEEKTTYEYTIIGQIGEKYKTEQKEIPYYEYVKDTGNTKGELKEEDTVEYYYKKQNFNIGIEKEIESINLNGKEIGITNKKLEKIEIKSKEIDKTELIVKYNIKITNKGEIKGTAQIEEQTPKGYKIIEQTEKWKTNKNGNIETKIELEAGESKNLELILKWENTEENLGTKTSTTKIINTENKANYKDTNKKDDIAEITTIISIKTGEIVSNTIIMIIVLSLGICSIIGISIMNKKGTKINNIKFLK